MGTEFITAFVLITMAEMGDKTQLLAMAFATKYPMRKVLGGVFLGALLNHGLAVLLGTYLSQWVPFDALQAVAAIAFILFGIWSLKTGDDEEEAGSGQMKWSLGPVMTVAVAFFIGEMGDKTQLAVIALASQGNNPLVILSGTVLGMVFTSAIGVLVGMKLGKKIPEVGLKIGSAGVFMIFGYLGLMELTASLGAGQWILFALPPVLLGILALMGRQLILESRKGISLYKRTAEKLRLNTDRIYKALEEAKAEGHQCAYCNETGMTTIEELQKYLKEAGEKEAYLLSREYRGPLCSLHREEREKLKESLKETVRACQECQCHSENCIGNQTRMILEQLIYGKNIPFEGNIDHYFSELERVDEEDLKC